MTEETRQAVERFEQLTTEQQQIVLSIVKELARLNKLLEK